MRSPLNPGSAVRLLAGRKWPWALGNYNPIKG